MASYNRKFCNICKSRFSPRTFEMHQKICKLRKEGRTIETSCLYCGTSHDGTYGSGAYCSSECLYSDRQRYQKTCPTCQRSVSVSQYASHASSCQGESHLDLSSWLIAPDKYRCPKCEKVFNKMGIGSHYKKIHGDFPKNLYKAKSTVSKKNKHQNCLHCQKKLNGKQRKYCSNKCKFDYLGNDTSYQAQRHRAIKRKLELIKIFGNQCQKCGYNKNLSSLCFHHKIESEKNFTLTARNITNFGWQTILDEAEKCELLCSNCHNEHHNPDLDMNKIKKNFSHLFDE